ncbi:hypothetical protein Tco_0591455 [Tanacetum coccineum]
MQPTKRPFRADVTQEQTPLSRHLEGAAVVIINQPERTLGWGGRGDAGGCSGGAVVVVVVMVMRMAAGGDGSEGVDDDDDDMMMRVVMRWSWWSGAATVMAAGGGKWHVKARELGDRVDREMGTNFGFAGVWPENFSGGGGLVAGGGRLVAGKR